MSSEFDTGSDTHASTRAPSQAGSKLRGPIDQPSSRATSSVDLQDDAGDAVSYAYGGFAPDDKGQEVSMPEGIGKGKKLALRYKVCRI